MHLWLPKPALLTSPAILVAQQPGQSKPFLGKCHPSKLAAGKDGVTNPEQSCQYCKDTGHLLENCLRLQAREQFLTNQEKLKEGLN